MAVRKSGDGGHMGTVPMPSTISARGKRSVWALCKADSNTRAITCTEPARLEVGVRIRVRFSGITSQRSAILSAISTGGILSTSSTMQVVSALSRYPISSNSGSLLPRALAGPEPSALKVPLPWPWERLQPAYWLARQAMTGWLVCTSTCQGQFS